MNEPKISVNVLSYNNQGHLKSCLEAILAQDYSNFELTLIDNNSKDGSEEFVRNTFPDIKIVQTGANLGYSGGHNLGIKQTDGQFVCFVNPDVVLKKNYLSEAIKPLLTDSGIAGVQGKLLRPQNFQGKSIIDGAGLVIQYSRRITDKGQLEADCGQYDTSLEVFAINGACPLYRRQALKNVEIFGEILDEDIFAYWDDTDLGWRLRLFGWKLWYQSTAVAIHERAAGKSPGGYKKIVSFIKHHKKNSLFTRRLNWKNHLFIIIKNDFGWPLWRDLPLIFCRESAMLIYLLVFEPKVLKIVPTFFKQLPKMIKKRKAIHRRRVVKSNTIDKWIE